MRLWLAADKYDKLLQQERELTDFIDNFDPNRAGVLNDCAMRQANIVQMLERVSRHLQLQGNMPNQRRFKEMQDELEYKKVGSGEGWAGWLDVNDGMRGWEDEGMRGSHSTRYTPHHTHKLVDH